MDDVSALIKSAVIIALVAVAVALVLGGIGWVLQRPYIWLPVIALFGFLIYRKQQRNRV